MSTTKRTATEASAVASIAIAVSLALSGAYIGAGVAALIGIALLVAYEKLKIKSIDLDPELIEEIANKSQKEIEQAIDRENTK